MMNFKPRPALAVLKAVVAVGLAVASASALAQATAWPTKPVKLVVPYGAGSSPDVIARILGEKLAPRLVQPVPV